MDAGNWGFMDMDELSCKQTRFDEAETRTTIWDDTEMTAGVDLKWKNYRFAKIY